MATSVRLLLAVLVLVVLAVHGRRRRSSSCSDEGSQSSSSEESLCDQLKNTFGNLCVDRCAHLQKRLDDKGCTDTCTPAGNRCLPTVGTLCTAGAGDCPEDSKCCSPPNPDLTCSGLRRNCRASCDPCSENLLGDVGNCSDGNVCCEDTYSIELVDGVMVPGNHSGRLEIVYRGVRGTVCDDVFGDEDAMVACRELGFTNIVSARAVKRRQVIDGTGPIILDDMECIGNESSLLDCENAGLFEENCDHEDDVGVECIYDPGL